MNSLTPSALFLILSTLTCPLMAENSILVQNGQKIGFLGDSITEQGAAASGYINLVIMGLKAEGIEATAIPAGVSGNTSGGMRSRLGPHVLDKGADWMTLSCGVNDVRLFNEGRAGGIEEFKKNVTDIVDRAIAKNVKVVLLTTTPLGEELDSERDKQIGPYNDFLRAYAKEKNLVLADVNAAFREALSKTPTPGETAGQRLLADGTHPNQEGQTLMAKTVLLALGVPPGDFPKVEKEWMENPCGKGVKVGKGLYALISRNQFEAVMKRSSKGRASAAQAIISGLWQKALEESGEPADSEKAATYAQGKISSLVDAYIKQNDPVP